MVRWTVDCETDWGGRSQNTLGLKYGLPKILELFKHYKVKGLFFVSTELLLEQAHMLKPILDQGHEVGSHGHFHLVYKDKFRARQDAVIAEDLIRKWTGQRTVEYRAPKFSYETDSVYSQRKGHLGLLKYTWFGGKVQDDAIFYMHPFDIVNDIQDAPNMFCRVWYSHPHLAYQKLIRLLQMQAG